MYLDFSTDNLNVDVEFLHECNSSCDNYNYNILWQLRLINHYFIRLCAVFSVDVVSQDCLG